MSVPRNVIDLGLMRQARNERRRCQDDLVQAFAGAGRALADDADQKTAALFAVDPEAARLVLRYILRRGLRHLRRELRRPSDPREAYRASVEQAIAIVRDAYTARLLELKTGERDVGGAA